jgi:hypothetical protein
MNDVPAVLCCMCWILLALRFAFALCCRTVLCCDDGMNKKQDAWCMVMIQVDLLSFSKYCRLLYKSTHADIVRLVDQIA